MYGIFTKILLFLTSYIPLYWLFAIYHWRDPLFLWAIILLTFVLIVSTKKILSLRSEVNLDATVELSHIEDISANNVVSYLFAYLLSMVRWDLGSIEGCVAFIFAFSLIGYVFIKYNLIFINPILNIILGLKLYLVSVAQSENIRMEQKVMLISKKNRDSLKIDRSIKVHRIDQDIFMDTE